MYTIVIGAGQYGTLVAQWLVSAGHEIAVIDQDVSACSEIDDLLGAVAVRGDGTFVDTLEEAGANRADLLIATTRSDDINLAICQLAKHNFGIEKTISVVNSTDNTDLFKLLGINTTVDISSIVLSRIQEGITSHGLIHLMPISDRDGTKLVCIKLPPGSSQESKQIKDLNIPSGSVISLVILRNGTAILPKDDTLIGAGDQVIAVTNFQEEEATRVILTNETGE